MAARIRVQAAEAGRGGEGPCVVEAGAPLRLDVALAGGSVRERDFVALYPTEEEAARDPHSSPDFEFVPPEAVHQRACTVSLRAPARAGPYVAVYVAEEAVVRAWPESPADAARLRVLPAPKPTYLLELHRGRNAFVLTARAPAGARGELSCTAQPWRVILRAPSPHGVPTTRTVHLPVPCDARHMRVEKLVRGRAAGLAPRCGMPWRIGPTALPPPLTPRRRPGGAFAARSHCTRSPARRPLRRRRGGRTTRTAPPEGCCRCRGWCARAGRALAPAPASRPGRGALHTPSDRRGVGRQPA